MNMLTEDAARQTGPGQIENERNASSETVDYKDDEKTGDANKALSAKANWPVNRGDAP